MSSNFVIEIGESNSLNHFNRRSSFIIFALDYTSCMEIRLSIVFWIFSLLSLMKFIVRLSGSAFISPRFGEIKA